MAAPSVPLDMAALRAVSMLEAKYYAEIHTPGTDAPFNVRPCSCAPRRHAWPGLALDGHVLCCSVGPHIYAHACAHHSADRLQHQRSCRPISSSLFQAQLCSCAHAHVCRSGALARARAWRMRVAGMHCTALVA